MFTSKVKNYMHSFWEYREWFEDADFTVIGSGIVGLQCAIELRKKTSKFKDNCFGKRIPSFWC